MQSDNHQIYKLTAERTGKPSSLYKELGTCVFSCLYKHLRRPKSLITKLKGVGTWYLRRERIRILLEVFPPDFEKKPEDFKHPLSLVEHENKLEIFKIFTERMKEYDEYIEQRNETRKKRYETEVLLTPFDEEDKS